ncbi:formimidoylglutamate deiminase [Massilia sp. W12]|uniref:formimidoylglutamate deiminase n=1 Tax=Massilia sp. W12 TaxID=3126507 RepID=UPI0030D166E4
MGELFAKYALLPQGWRKDVLLRWDAQGALTEVSPGVAPQAGQAQVRHVLPGMVNLHSHAFQRAMAGMTEFAGDTPDSFWSWRDLMYRFALNITPQHVSAIAAQLYAECLRYGYTSVCEFHYVQRAADGEWYPDQAEMARRVLQAARDCGIGLTLLPVLYSHAGFGDLPLRPDQRRFKTSVDDILSIVHAMEAERDAQFEIGAAPHSLRAANVAQIRALRDALPPGRPLHIHIAEQQKEVDDCMAFCGQRPVEYLTREVGLDARWTLVHATHLSADETSAIAASGAVAGLCPSTEANLGDGLFPLADYLRQGGRIGIGSDSHVSQSAVEELRWLEYGQRLRAQGRNIAASSAQRYVGDYLWAQSLAGGAQASARAVGQLTPGCRADLLVLDERHPNLAHTPLQDVLNTLIFCGNDNLVRDVMVGGVWRVRDGRHLEQDAIAARFAETMRELQALRRQGV